MCNVEATAVGEFLTLILIYIDLFLRFYFLSERLGFTHYECSNIQCGFYTVTSVYITLIIDVCVGNRMALG